MKSIFYILTFLTFTHNLCLYAYQPTRGSQLVHEIIANTAKRAKSEYGLSPCGSGASMPGGPIRTINISFDSRKAYTRDQLRELLIKITQLMIQEVNDNKEIQQYLLAPPFSEKNVQIIIFNQDHKGYTLYDPDICGAQITSDGLIYRTNDITDRFKYKNTYKETYEEALKLLINK